MHSSTNMNRFQVTVLAGMTEKKYRLGFEVDADGSVTVTLGKAALKAWNSSILARADMCRAIYGKYPSAVVVGNGEVLDELR